MRAGGWRTAALLLAGALLAVVPPFLPAYPLTLLTQALIYAIFAMSLDLLLGYTGLPSLGHAAYFGVVAYVVGIFTTEYGAGFWTCLLLAVLAATATGAVFGLVAIRAVGTYFLMITLALGMVVWGLAFRRVSVTKGDNGISGVPRPAIGAWSFGNQTAFYYLTLVAFLLGRDVADGGPRRAGHAGGPDARRGRDRVPQELRERVHQALAAHPGRRVHLRDPVRSPRDPRHRRRDNGRREARSLTPRPPSRARESRHASTADQPEP